MTESFTNYEFELKYNFFMKPFLIQTHAQYGPDYAVLLAFLSGIIILACGLLQLGNRRQNLKILSRRLNLSCGINMIGST